MKRAVKKIIIKIFKIIKKIIKAIKKVGIKKVLKILIFSLLLILLATLLLKINVKTKKISTNNIKIELDKETRNSYPKTASLWGTIEIPSLKIKTNLYKGSDKLLKYGALHHDETYFPTDGKVILISASSKYFKNLSKAKENEKITLNTLYGIYNYKIIKTRIRTVEKLKEEINNIDSETLILYADLNESQRVVVYAR